jgi:hypothetical protein
MFAVYAAHAAADDPPSALKIGERPEPDVPVGWVRVRRTCPHPPSASRARIGAPPAPSTSCPGRTSAAGGSSPWPSPWVREPGRAVPFRVDRRPNRTQAGQRADRSGAWNLPSELFSRLC